VQLDFDVVVLRPFDMRNAIAWMDDQIWLNGGVMVFDKEHPFLKLCLHDFALQYDGLTWGHNGPSLLTRMYKQYKDLPAFSQAPVNVLDTSAFYPISNGRIKTCASLWSCSATPVSIVLRFPTQTAAASELHTPHTRTALH
jgi:Alpha 1,4-glycosyltransferase conserved region